MYGVVNGPNLDKDSSQIVVCPEREAAVCSCVSVSLVNAFVVIATPGESETGQTQCLVMGVRGLGWQTLALLLLNVDFKYVSILNIYYNSCQSVHV